MYVVYDSFKGKWCVKICVLFVEITLFESESEASAYQFIRNNGLDPRLDVTKNRKDGQFKL